MRLPRWMEDALIAAVCMAMLPVLLVATCGAMLWDFEA